MTDKHIEITTPVQTMTAYAFFKRDAEQLASEGRINEAVASLQLGRRAAWHETNPEAIVMPDDTLRGIEQRKYADRNHLVRHWQECIKAGERVTEAIALKTARVRQYISEMRYDEFTQRIYSVDGWTVALRRNPQAPWIVDPHSKVQLEAAVIMFACMYSQGLCRASAACILMAMLKHIDEEGL